ncbi:MobF family relaxase [Yersinia pestis]|uniref:MobF family relaxase n=2 Tax=Enterobacterales TaxID=91347 RepID=UPI00092EE0D8|nr:MobF family relaxase [Yersinia pestis]KAA5780369.1 conjugative relaxase [Yersinia pestis]KAA5824702.1 conjugative relaxase [Yersinia pestis]OSZ85532.1 conjugal transfer protein TraI [Yersinia pestis subsp. microtus bv. Caucasica]OSZ86244.1 conjugal transfer protein TraI [Yersinia pestis subsp. microtus bv. Caucasica]OSZ96697.1 conjugal transfer protein TraI [Yersinia pestis subsp. microtus bv. Caucasica]
MMSIGSVKSAGSAGNYYTDKDNYYVIGSMGERWAGKGAEALGLSGGVDQKVFTKVLEGRLPDGSDLSRTQDGANKHRPGYDFTFSAPKSVSVMAMLGGDKRLIEAHNRAVETAIKQIEAMASTRVMTEGRSETQLTGNLVMALFNHDTSRDQEPQLHTHAVVANATQHGDEWRTLSSDKVGKTGFIENIYANQIAFGRLYRAALKDDVAAMGYETETVGKHGMWEFKGVPVAPFSSRSRTISEAVGDDASLKSRDVAAMNVVVNAGIPLRTNGRYAIMHDKVIIVDNHTVEAGSFNYTRSAASRNSENVLVINEVPEVAQTYLQHWQSRWDGGTDWHSSYKSP